VAGGGEGSKFPTPLRPGLFRRLGRRSKPIILWLYLGSRGECGADQAPSSFSIFKAGSGPQSSGRWTPLLGAQRCEYVYPGIRWASLLRGHRGRPWAPVRSPTSGDQTPCGLRRLQTTTRMPPIPSATVHPPCALSTVPGAVSSKQTSVPRICQIPGKGGVLEHRYDDMMRGGDTVTNQHTIAENNSRRK